MYPLRMLGLLFPFQIGPCCCDAPCCACPPRLDCTPLPRYLSQVCTCLKFETWHGCLPHQGPCCPLMICSTIWMLIPSSFSRLPCPPPFCSAQPPRRAAPAPTPAGHRQRRACVPRSACLHKPQGMALVTNARS
ncbi:MAG: hypothetical protein J3K34DRAFT_404475, partial [Monoraphidium minutum]